MHYITKTVYYLDDYKYTFKYDEIMVFYLYNIKCIRAVIAPATTPTHLCLTAGVGRVLVDDDLVYLAELAKILWFLQHILQ